jgi:hypothetical protein
MAKDRKPNPATAGQEIRTGLLFLKKKKQKDFSSVFSERQFSAERAVPLALPNREKFFGSFFQKRTF